MADIGFQISGTNITTATIVPDKTLQRQVNPRVRSATFGDGYIQRIADGLNSLNEVFTVNLTNKPKATADDIIKFFEDKKAVTSFSFTFPDENSSSTDSSGNKVTTIKVVCANWSLMYSSSDHYTIMATFNRVYEP